MMKLLIFLTDKPPGTFLIRFSSKEYPGCFTISKVNQNSQIGHQRILHKPGSPFASPTGKSYPTLIDLVTMTKEELNLQIPCPGSKYQALFQEKPSVRPLY